MKRAVAYGLRRPHMARTGKVSPKRGGRLEQLSIPALYVRYKDILLNFLFNTIISHFSVLLVQIYLLVVLNISHLSLF